MRDVYQEIAQVAGSPTTVMIRGESGTGKEMVAHAIHYNSPRADRPFVKVNCGALPDTLIESELFGYEAGAFTDAREQKKGRFELADGGTLFLDEVGALSQSTQVKLLRALQEKEFERLGGVQPVQVDVRLIAATNSDLESAMRQGVFREDLYYRLNVFSIFMPALHDRKPDILLLVDHFAEKYASVLGRSVRRISTSAIDLLMAYHWPGNVRELENCIERAVLVCAGGVIHGHDLPPTLQTAQLSDTLPKRPRSTSPWGTTRRTSFWIVSRRPEGTKPKLLDCSRPANGSSATSFVSTASIPQITVRPPVQPGTPSTDLRFRRFIRRMIQKYRTPIPGWSTRLGL
jgi:Nif-specific regulatory protein